MKGLCFWGALTAAAFRSPAGDRRVPGRDGFPQTQAWPCGGGMGWPTCMSGVLPRAGGGAYASGRRPVSAVQKQLTAGGATAWHSPSQPERHVRPV